MAKVTANGSRRSYTGATFGGGSLSPSEQGALKNRLKKKRKILAQKRAAMDQLVEKVRKEFPITVSLPVNKAHPQMAKGSQLADALRKAIKSKLPYSS